MSADVKYLVAHVVEAFGAGVAHSISNIVNGYDENSKYTGVVIHGSRDFNKNIAETLTDTKFFSWCCDRELSVKNDYKAFIDLLRLLRKISPHVIHAHSSKAGFHARLAGYLLGIPCVYTPHSFSFLRQDIGFLQKTIFYGIEFILSKTALTIACGLEEFYYARKFSKNTIAIENGVDTKIFAPRVRGDRENLKILAIGRITAQKDFDFFQKIASRVEVKNFEFIWLAGEEINFLAPSNNITLIDSLPPKEVADLLRNSDMYINTSKWEGLSRAALEASACGLPLVLRECPGNIEVAFNNRHAALFRDVDEAVDRILSIKNKLNDDPLFGNFGVKVVGSRYNGGDIARRVQFVYDGLVFVEWFKSRLRGRSKTTSAAVVPR